MQVLENISSCCLMKMNQFSNLDLGYFYKNLFYHENKSVNL